MLRSAQNVRRVCCIACIFAAVATGQTPVYSLEVVEVGGNDVPGGPTARMTVAPGDVLTAMIFLRDWSPTGEGLRGYQMQMDPAGYTSGSGGNVEPVNYRAAQDAKVSNSDHAFIDENDPRYVFFGFRGWALTDSRSAGYRWIGVIPTGGIPAPQDGTRFYCGTLKLAVSKDARGTFTIGFKTGAPFSYLSDEEARGIGPVAYEPLTLSVSSGSRQFRSETRIKTLPGDVNSDGSIDAADVFALIDALNLLDDPPILQADVDGDGVSTAADILRLIDLFTNPRSAGHPSPTQPPGP